MILQKLVRVAIELKWRQYLLPRFGRIEVIVLFRPWQNTINPLYGIIIFVIIYMYLQVDCVFTVVNER